MLPKNCVVIEVQGGLVSDVITPPGIEYVIVDWDNIKAGDSEIYSEEMEGDYEEHIKEVEQELENNGVAFVE
jgi:hypothetical protein